MAKLTVPMSEDELAMLKAVAKRDGRSMAAWVRWGVREAYTSSPKATKEIPADRLCVCGHTRSMHLHGNGHCEKAPAGCYCRDFAVPRAE